MRLRRPRVASTLAAGAMLAMIVIPVLAAASAAAPERPGAGRPLPIVIGHRGASGYRPEHTLAGYERSTRR